MALIFTFFGPAVGGALFAMLWAGAEFVGGDASAAVLVITAVAVLWPLAYLIGLPAALACGVVAALQTWRHGRPGWWAVMLTAALGAGVVVARGEAPGVVEVGQGVAHLGAAAAATALARVVLRPKT